MKKTTIISLSLIVALAITSGATAKEARPGKSAVKPVEIVQPVVFERDYGKTILLRVRVDEQGRPTQVDAVGVDYYDQDLADRVVRAVADWTFTPVGNRGAVYELPVHIGA